MRMVVWVNSTEFWSVQVMQVKAVPLCLESTSSNVAVDTRGFVDFSSKTKSPIILTSFSELVLVYTFISVQLKFPELVVIFHIRTIALELLQQVITKLLLIQSSKDSFAGSSIAAKSKSKAIFANAKSQRNIYLLSNTYRLRCCMCRLVYRI